VLLPSGCGAQLSFGWPSPARKASFMVAPSTLSLGVRAYDARRSAPFFGAEATSSMWSFDDDLTLRQVSATGGYRINCTPFAFEPGADLAVGTPLLRSSGGSSAYLGASGAVLARVSGEHDQRRGYAVGGFLLDLVFSGRIGVWGQQAESGGRELVEGALLVGLRASVMSDVALTRDDWAP
jgi:hypothetical protein